MNKELLNFCFEKIGYKKVQSKQYLVFRKGLYIIKIDVSKKTAIFNYDNVTLYQTGLPTTEMSIVKWVNLLVKKHIHEKETKQSD